MDESPDGCLAEMEWLEPIWKLVMSNKEMCIRDRYKGDHYHLTVSSDWGEDIFVDTNDVWDNGDHVGISIFPESTKITQIVES